MPCSRNLEGWFHNGGQGPQSSSGMGDTSSGGLVGIISLCANDQSAWRQHELGAPVGSKGITQIPLGFSTALLGAGLPYWYRFRYRYPSWCTFIAWAGFVPYPD